jgi:hypothetical protein
LVSRVDAGPPLKIEIQRPRALRLLGNFCKDPYPDYDPHHIYVLKDERFQLLGMRPPNGCEASLSDATGSSVQ